MVFLMMNWAQCIFAQASGSAATSSTDTPLRVDSRAVLVDVLVTDKKAAPVRGLPQSAFSVKEQGKLQTITFEENDRTGALEVKLPLKQETETAAAHTEKNETKLSPQQYLPMITSVAQFKCLGGP